MNQIELKEQAEFIKWVRNNYKEFSKNIIGVNNNSSNGMSGGIAKALGVNKGTSDFIFACPNGVTLYVEYKALDGNQSLDQKIFQREIERFGHKYVLVYGIDQLKQTFINSFNIF
jgi:hypothetical protein